MALVKYDPFEEMRSLQKQIFGDMDDDFWSTASKSVQMPTTDIYAEDDKQMVVEAHLPHFEQKDIDVSVDRGILSISAEKHEKEEDKKKKYVLRESSSSFYRRIALPKHADGDNVSAHFEKGVLKVTVPFKELPKPKKVQIKAKN